MQIIDTYSYNEYDIISLFNIGKVLIYKNNKLMNMYIFDNEKGILNSSFLGIDHSMKYDVMMTNYHSNKFFFGNIKNVLNFFDTFELSNINSIIKDGKWIYIALGDGRIKKVNKLDNSIINAPECNIPYKNYYCEAICKYAGKDGFFKKNNLYMFLRNPEEQNGFLTDMNFNICFNNISIGSFFKNCLIAAQHNLEKTSIVIYNKDGMLIREIIVRNSKINDMFPYPGITSNNKFCVFQYRECKIIFYTNKKKLCYKYIKDNRFITLNTDKIYFVEVDSNLDLIKEEIKI